MRAKEQLSVEIRPWSEADLPLLERLTGDPAMTRYLGGPETPEQIRERHARYCRSHQPGEGPMFVIEAGPEKVAAGSIGYWDRDLHGQHLWETGWSILPEFRERGVATAAAALLMKRANAEGRHRFIHAFPAVDDEPSNAICRKLGFALMGQVDIEYPSGHTMSCNDWRLDLFASSNAE
jgi:RimJ/RimL family protein N-acetyltransferase